MCAAALKGLAGKRVLVTRAREQGEHMAALLREQGADPVVVPTIEVRAPTDPAPLDRAVRDLMGRAYAWAAFTSANGVARTWEALVAAGGDARAFDETRIAAIGAATARAAGGRGLRVDLTAKQSRGEGLAEEMLRAGVSGRVLLARAAKARDALPRALREAGCTVDDVAAYETHAPPPEVVARLVAEIEAGRLDAVVLTSGSTVDNLCDALGPARSAELLARTRLASIGPVTTEAARARGLRVRAEAAEPSAPALVRALAESYESEP